MRGVFEHDLVYGRLFALAMLALISLRSIHLLKTTTKSKCTDMTWSPPGTRWSNFIATSRAPSVSRYRRS
jgi:hypothetical protein